MRSKRKKTLSVSPTRNYAPRSLLFLLSRIVVAPAAAGAGHHAAMSRSGQATALPRRRLSAAAGVGRERRNRRRHRPAAGRGRARGSGRIRKGADASRYGPEAVQVRVCVRAYSKKTEAKRARRGEKETRRLVITAKKLNLLSRLLSSLSLSLS